jgi:hypothetical protein
MTGDTRKRTFGLAAILVIGTIAGFLVAAGTSGAEYATVGTISDSQAFQMPAEEDQRVRFALEASQDTADQPAVSFALYDPGDEFFTEIQLEGDGDDAEAILDESGPWVLFVTERRNAELQVQYEASDEAGDVELEEIPVAEERTVVAEQQGGSLDEQVTFRLAQRPAAAFLAYDGDIEGLDATVSTDEGPVYELSDARANQSEEGTTRSGDVSVTSANLAAGTYEVEATADAFDGELVFVQQSYERQDAQTTTEEEVEQENVTTYADENEGTIVAELEERQAYEVHTADSATLTFLTDGRTEADLMVYNASDRLVREVQIDRQEDHDWDDEDDEHERGPNATAKTVELPRSGSYVVYADEVYPGEHVVDVFVPDTQAQADEMELETHEATLEGNEDAWNTTLGGALLEIHAYSQDVAGMDRNVTATGEAGTVLHYEQSVNSFGAAMHQTHEVYPDRFTDGHLEVTMDGDGVAGETHVEVVNYVR